MDFLHFLISWKYWKLKSPLFPGSWKYGRRAGGGGRAAPGVVLCCLGLFLEHVPGKMNMVTLELRSKQTLFWKWLPRPNHYAHKICIEILSRTPVLKSRYLSSEFQMYMENSEYSSPARMSTWVSSHDCTTGWDTTHDWNARSHDSRPRLVRDPW